MWFIYIVFEISLHFCNWRLFVMMVLWICRMCKHKVASREVRNHLLQIKVVERKRWVMQLKQGRSLHRLRAHRAQLQLLQQMSLQRIKLIVHQLLQRYDIHCITQFELLQITILYISHYNAFVFVAIVECL